ncbi:uncharacterized protein [Henckelia pumila]|uniref:uncharacterized protein n=1 Tax=Henckelia pumila TaxID=405737 RepID=UPI003C6E5110
MDATLTPMEVLFERFQMYDPPILKGTEDAIACESWLEELDHLFESLDYFDERIIRLIIYQLQDLARSWWVVTKQSMENRGSVITWQGNLTVESNVSKFFNLLRFVPPVVDDEEVQADLFINGLNSEIYTWINAERPNNMADAIEKAK